MYNKSEPDIVGALKYMPEFGSVQLSLSYLAKTALEDRAVVRQLNVIIPLSKLEFTIRGASKGAFSALVANQKKAVAEASRLTPEEIQERVNDWLEAGGEIIQCKAVLGLSPAERLRERTKLDSLTLEDLFPAPAEAAAQ